MVLYAAADLVFATRIKHTATDAGVEARPVRSVPMLLERLNDADVRAILLDLDAPERAFELLGVLRGPQADPTHRAVRTLAWGPHVDHELLGHARTAGADLVMTRGAFVADLANLLRRLDAPADD